MTETIPAHLLIPHGHEDRCDGCADCTGIDAYGLPRPRWRRPWTASRKNWLTGTTRITVKRCCNGCNRQLGDATRAEMNAAISGRDLPDVREECGCLVCTCWTVGSDGQRLLPCERHPDPRPGDRR